MVENPQLCIARVRQAYCWLKCGEFQNFHKVVGTKCVRGGNNHQMPYYYQFSYLDTVEGVVILGQDLTELLNKVAKTELAITCNVVRRTGYSCTGIGK